MSETLGPNRSVSIGGDAIGNAVVTGDGNTVSVQFQQASLPEPSSVDISETLQVLQEILAGMDDPVIAGVAQKLSTEAEKTAPDKNVIATTLETGLTYAKTLSGFSDSIEKLRPPVEAVVAWLGKHGHKLLPLIGLTL